MRSNQISLALAGVAGPAGRYSAVDELGGRILAISERMDLAIGQLADVPTLDAARDETRRTLLSEGESVYRRTNQALRDGAAPPLSLVDYRAWTVPMLAKGLLVRNAAFAEVRSQAADLGVTATRRRTIAIGVAVLAVVAAVGAVTILLVWVAQPLNALTSAMVTLAEGDTSIAVPGVGRHDELGAMARAVEVFKSSESKISWMALHDGLTRLPNRVQLRRRLDGVLATGERPALLMLDLDRFKGVNDTLGHGAGDMLLAAVAVRLRGCVRECDVVARLGGDEFAVLMAGPAQPGDAGVLAQRLVDAIGSPFEIEGHQVRIGTSIGVVIAGEGASSEALARNADQALYEAKAQGRGTFSFHDPEMDRKLQRTRELEADLREAVAAQALLVFYQPIVDLVSHRIIGMEALLRWEHPTRGAVPPSEFVRLAEETGLIRPLGAFVLRTACAAATGWPEEVGLAVNLSPVQFQAGDLADVVAHALATAGLAGSRLTLEITEHVLLHEDDATHAQLGRLRGLGAKICLDDFGMGYSSLSYLQAFPFDAIKIDQSFVRDLERRERARAIVRAIASLGATLGLPTTAEGVQSWEQLEAVRAFGCTSAQGYLFSEARPAGEVLAVLAAQDLAGWPGCGAGHGAGDGAERGYAAVLSEGGGGSGVA